MKVLWLSNKTTEENYGPIKTLEIIIEGAKKVFRLHG